MTFVERAVFDPSITITKAEIAARLAAVIPSVHHIETGRSLDNRM
jgi:hypothetical protein